MKFNRYRKSLGKFWRRLQNRIYGGKRILVLGDSHCGIFEYCFDQGLLAPHLLNCEIVAGATAYGLRSNHSSTQSWQRFDAALQRFANFDIIVIMLGECDCSFLLWKKAEKLHVPPESLIQYGLEGIARICEQIIKIPNHPKAKKIILVGATLPTVPDFATEMQENPLRREITASQIERTRLVLMFNENLKMMANALKLTYIELTSQTLNSETGLVDIGFVANPLDHHLSHPASSSLWSKCLLDNL